MARTLIEDIEKAQMKKEQPKFKVGDTVQVSKILMEDKKKRTQKFDGIVTKIKGFRSRLSFTVRKIMDNVGVERTFMFHSPLITDIKIIKSGKIRRAKLNYLRARIGAKATSVKNKD